MLQQKAIEGVHNKSKPSESISAHSHKVAASNSARKW